MNIINNNIINTLMNIINNNILKIRKYEKIFENRLFVITFFSAQ